MLDMASTRSYILSRRTVRSESDCAFPTRNSAFAFQDRPDIVGARIPRCICPCGKVLEWPDGMGVKDEPAQRTQPGQREPDGLHLHLRAARSGPGIRAVGLQPLPGLRPRLCLLLCARRDQNRTPGV